METNLACMKKMVLVVVEAEVLVVVMGAEKGAKWSRAWDSDTSQANKVMARKVTVKNGLLKNAHSNLMKWCKWKWNSQHHGLQLCGR